ncbi:hypothetical protein C2G38_2208661 [Gigaspora rosea]|uniref:Uncharacterized protein n=1 Tax=Gigaspora rosea TaxID=44941 RepID=A0A397UK94_9GLOM|nr:hypothetical protein C2G38_2208661 [Gigaspora rosea]
MLLQLFFDEKTLADIIKNYELPSLWNVLVLIAKYEDKKLENATVILVVNGLYNTMTTTAGPIENFIAELSRKHVFLLVSSLKPPTVIHDSIIKNVFDISNPIIRLLLAIPLWISHHAIYMALDNGYCSWQYFKYFNTSFRCLKSRILNKGEITSISEIYHGANLNGDIHFKNHHLQLDTASQQVDTRSTRSNSEQCSSIQITEYQFNFHPEELYNERKKSASEDDYFIFITTKDNLDIELLCNSGIVYKQNWDDYFGLFAGRAFIFAVEGPPNINTAGCAQIELVIQVGKIQIITKRPFYNIQDMANKTSIPEKVLKRFKYE